jgi:hypothetical protein
VPAGKIEVLIFDTRQRGFFLRKYASGKADYGVMYTANGKRRKVMLGRDASVKGNLTKARQEAEDVRAKARIDGRDVLDDRKAAVTAAARAMTVLDAAKEYIEARRGDWKPRYVIEVERHLLGTSGTVVCLQVDPREGRGAGHEERGCGRC